MLLQLAILKGRLPLCSLLMLAICIACFNPRARRRRAPGTTKTIWLVVTTVLQVR